jgi:phosphoserine phosphatase RsbU/P
LPRAKIPEMRALNPDLPALRALVGHRQFVPAHETLEAVQQRFHDLPQNFLAVLEGRSLLGLCSRRDLGTLLGSRYGFALHGRSPIAQHLTPNPLIIKSTDAIPGVLQAVATRRDEHFYDDVLLVDGRGDFLGLIHVRDLVRLQTSLLTDNLEEMKARNRQMEDDLQLARQVQLALLPRTWPVCRAPDGTRLGFAQLFKPAGGVSGDFFDVIPVSDTAAGLIVCDVMGHGVRSAFVTAIVRTMLEELRRTAAGPADLLRRLNHDLTGLLRRAGDLIFVTAACVLVDLSAGLVRYAHAGHPPPLHWSRRRQTVEALPDLARIGGPALGLEEDFAYAEAWIPVEAGDRLLLYTDGVTEASNSEGAEFGFQGLSRALREHAAVPWESVPAGLHATAVEFAGHEALDDDVCLVGCEVAGA